MPTERPNYPVRFLTLGFFFLIAGAAAAGWYGYEEIHTLSARVVMLEAQFATTTSQLQQGIADTQGTLSSALQEQQQQSSALATQMGTVQQQFGTITSSVSNLEKLSKTDPQLLAKYSKVYFLNENYMPASLSTIPKAYTYDEKREYSIHAEVSPYLISMIDAAKQSGVKFYVDSAYRSFDEQQALKGQYTVVYGGGTANSFSADQGYSEHQLGTAVDFITGTQGGSLTGFDKTSSFTWMNENAYRFGFVLSYPKGNTYYVYEPWHWRFVGVKLATYLHDNSKHFYELDQREINTYLADLFD